MYHNIPYYTPLYRTKLPYTDVDTYIATILQPYYLAN